MFEVIAAVTARVWKTESKKQGLKTEPARKYIEPLLSETATS